MGLADAEAEEAADCPRWHCSRWSGIGANGPCQQVIVWSPSLVVVIYFRKIVFFLVKSCCVMID
jgi:hypothetical protein